MIELKWLFMQINWEGEEEEEKKIMKPFCESNLQNVCLL